MDLLKSWYSQQVQVAQPVTTHLSYKTIKGFRWRREDWQDKMTVVWTHSSIRPYNGFIRRLSAPQNWVGNPPKSDRNDKRLIGKSWLPMWCDSTVNLGASSKTRLDRNFGCGKHTPLWEPLEKRSLACQWSLSEETPIVWQEFTLAKNHELATTICHI